jgi:hypothetical protein
VSSNTLEDEVKSNTYFDKDGNPTRQTINGRLVVELTNVDTDKSIVYNISGSGVHHLLLRTARSTSCWEDGHSCSSSPDTTLEITDPTGHTRTSHPPPSRE